VNCDEANFGTLNFVLSAFVIILHINKLAKQTYTGSSVEKAI
jgi:hypothetical protein